MSFTWDLVALALVCLFFAACFIQSGIDKVLDWRGNMNFLKEHFSLTPMRGLVPIMMLLITVLELFSGAACLVAGIGAFTLGPWLALPALTLCGVTLLMLFTGQRIAKDYAGAATLATYFVVAIVGLMIAVYAATPHPSSSVDLGGGGFNLPRTE